MSKEEMLKICEEISIRCSICDNPLKAKINGLGYIIKTPKIIEDNGYSFIFKDEVSERIKRLTKI